MSGDSTWLWSVWAALINALWALGFAFADAGFWRDTLTAIVVISGLGFLAQQRVAWLQDRWQEARDERNAERAIAEAEKTQQRRIYLEAHELYLGLEIAKGMLATADARNDAPRHAAALRTDVNDRLSAAAIVAERLTVESELAYGLSPKVVGAYAVVTASIALGANDPERRRSVDLAAAVDAARNAMAELRGLMRDPVRLAQRRPVAPDD